MSERKHLTLAEAHAAARCESCRGERRRCRDCRRHVCRCDERSCACHLEAGTEPAHEERR